MSLYIRTEKGDAILNFDFSEKFDIIFFYKKIFASAVQHFTSGACCYFFFPCRRFVKQYSLFEGEKNDSK